MRKNLLLIIFSIFFISTLSSPDVLNTESTRLLQSSAVGDTNLTSSSFDIPNFFTVYYDFEPAGYITMVLKFLKPNQYFSIGFGKKMDKTDMWVFELIGSEIIASDHIGSGHKSPLNDVNKGGKNDLERLGYEITPTYSLVKVRRALNTGDPNDAVITQNQMDLIYATARARTMAEHRGSELGYGLLTLVKGGNAIFISQPVPNNSEEVHSVVNLITWGIAVDLFIIFVKLMKGRKWMVCGSVISSQTIHALFMTIIAVVSVFVTAILIKTNRKDRGAKLTQKPDVDFHFINGLIFLFLIITTVCIGIAEFMFLRGYKKSAKSALLLKNLHRLFALLLNLIAKANIITGVIIHENGEWKIPVFIYIGVLFLVHVLIQLKYSSWEKNSNALQPAKTHPTYKPEYKLLLQALNDGTPLEKLLYDFPTIKWVILGNNVYDLTGWIHPGGNSLIEVSVGREVGRYLYGNHALEGSKMKPHKHSALAFSQMNSFWIGEIKSTESVLVSNDWPKSLGRLDSLKTKAKPDFWRITTITPVSDTVSQISFKNPNYAVKNFGKSLSWIGRSFRVSFDNDSSPARLYTTAFALTKANFDLRQSMYQYFDAIMAGTRPPVFRYENNYLNPQDELPLFVKNYNMLKKSFSSSMHKTPITGAENRFRIEGPIGRGLELLPSSSGTHCIICAGTGVLPFIDFMALFLWKTMYELIKVRAGTEKAEVINILNIPFGTMMNGMRVKFIGTFANEKEVLGIDIIRKLAEINKKYRRDCFTAMIKGFKGDENITEVKGRFSSSFLGHALDKEEDEKYYVVGPLAFNEQVMEALSELGISKNKILLV